jgi:hypothetical protein
MSQQTASRAKRIGALLFCPACGTLLDLPRDDQDEIDCHQCGRKEPASCEWFAGGWVGWRRGGRGMREGDGGGEEGGGGR